MADPPMPGPPAQSSEHSGCAAAWASNAAASVLYAVGMT
jgi:hypothetical protein